MRPPSSAPICLGSIFVSTDVRRSALAAAPCLVLVIARAFLFVDDCVGTELDDHSRDPGHNEQHHHTNNQADDQIVHLAIFRMSGQGLCCIGCRLRCRTGRIDAFRVSGPLVVFIHRFAVADAIGRLVSRGILRELRMAGMERVGQPGRRPIFVR